MINIKNSMEFEKVIAVPVPNMTETYKPISHLEAIAYVESKLIGNWTRNIYGDGQYITVIWEQEIADSELIACIYLRNSYNKKVKFIIDLIMKVKVCSNGLYRTQKSNQFVHKHQGAIQEIWKPNVDIVFTGFNNTINTYTNIKNAFKQIPISKKGMLERLIDMTGTRGALVTPKDAIDIKREINSPTFNYHNGETMWDFYNHITKYYNNVPYDMFDRTHRLLNSQFNLINPEVKELVC